jgi:uncharacterized protein (TIGR02284 family)
MVHDNKQSNGQSRASSEDDDEGLATALRALSALCHDSEAGYRKAAQDTDNEDLKFEFEELAEGRAKMADSLDKTLSELGIEPASGGTSVGAAHRAFLELRSKLQHGNPKAIFTEIARGEGTFEDAFDKTLKFAMPQNLRRQLQGQHRAIRQARDYYTALAGRVGSPRSGRRLASVRQLGSRITHRPLTAVAVVAATALALGAIAQLTHRDRPSRLLDHRRIRDIDARDLRDLEKRAHRGLQKLTKHFGGYR